MKKIIAMVLCLVLALSLVGCGNKAKTEDTVIMTATITDIGTDNKMDALYVTANDKNYVVYNWKDYIADGAIFHDGGNVEIAYNGIVTEENPAALCGVTRVTQIMESGAIISK